MVGISIYYSFVVLEQNMYKPILICETANDIILNPFELKCLLFRVELLLISNDHILIYIIFIYNPDIHNKEKLMKLKKGHGKLFQS